LDQTAFAQDPDHPRRTADVRRLLGDRSAIDPPDVLCDSDLPSRLEEWLAAGAADYYASLLGTHAKVAPVPFATQRTLVVSGSYSTWKACRLRELKSRGFVTRTVDDLVSGSIWNESARVCLCIGEPRHGEPVAWMHQRVANALLLVDDAGDLRLAVEGGTTARAIVDGLGWHRFTAIDEGMAGVGSLPSPGGALLC
jgi:hypothetical protein